jgi:hypothetical protein
MAKQKLPTNLVRAPVFDSPLRRTEPRPPNADSADIAPIAVLRPERPIPESADLSPIIQTHRGRAESPPEMREGAEGETNGEVEDEHSELLVHRTTLRLPQDVHETLEREAFARRMQGERTNPASVAREVLTRWARSARRRRSV